MKYLSDLQIQEALDFLRPYHVFFSTTFLALKKADIPIGSMTSFTLDAANRDFLNRHFRVHPKSRYFFRVMRVTHRRQDWSKPDYASTGLQAVNTQSFSDALLHEWNENLWGWTEDYVQHLVNKLPGRSRKVPLFHLAVWLYKYEEWDDDIRRSAIVGRMIRDYRLTPDELNDLFEESVYSELSEEEAFQSTRVQWHEILAPYERPPDVPPENGGVLKYLETTSLGPTSSMVFSPAQRLNLITGDNGLGKTFLLDLAWWALTRDWADLRATPLNPSSSIRPTIRYLVEGGAQVRPVTAEYVGGDWSIRGGTVVLSGLVVYARVDGSFAVWDPANHALSQLGSGRWPGIKFTREEVWDGKPGQIEGLIRDLVRWQQRSDRYPAFSTFLAVLDQLYAPDLGPLSLDEPVRIPYDPREIPTFKHPYGNVPLPYESAGIRRIITLAYLLVWVWEEHKIHALQQGKPEERQMVVLLDEAEAHLHPKWQRAILPGLLGVAEKLHSEMSAQWIISTHSPLVLASIEGMWDTSSDRLFHIVMNSSGVVTFQERQYEKRGPIDSWLTSDFFELRYPGSAQRELAIQSAIALQLAADPKMSEVEEATDQLKQYLGPEDPFWTRWIFFADSFGVTP